MQITVSGLHMRNFRIVSSLSFLLFPSLHLHNSFDFHRILFSLCTIPTPAPLGHPPAHLPEGLSDTTRRPDSCVSLRPYLHDTQLPYPTSCYTPSFRQRCKGRTPTPAGHVSDSVGSALILRPWGSAPTRRASGSVWGILVCRCSYNCFSVHTLS